MLSYISIVFTYYLKNHNSVGNFEVLFSEMIFENTLLQDFLLLFKLQ